MNRFIFHGQHSSAAQPTKIFFLLAIVAALMVSGWLGIASPGDRNRQILVLACIAVFVGRTAFMVIYLLPRSMGWREAFGDAVVVWLVACGLGVYWADAADPLGWLDGLALMLFLAGSALTTGSELGRKRWKQHHQGQLYTRGPFRFAQHINYFGEVVSFAGVAMMTRTWWAAVVPVGMFLFFVLVHMPALDRHLRERYGDDFADYQNRTHKIVPFVY